MRSCNEIRYSSIDRCFDKNRVTTRIMSLTPGTLWLRFHQKFGHGLRVAWYRECKYARAFCRRPPSRVRCTSVCENRHVLTSKNDRLSLVCSHSFPAVLLAPFICKLVMAARKVAERLRKLRTTAGLSEHAENGSSTPRVRSLRGSRPLKCTGHSGDRL